VFKLSGTISDATGGIIMAKRIQRRRSKSFGLAAEVFRNTAAAMQACDAASDRYDVLRRQLSSLGRKLRRSDGNVQTRLTQMMADGAKAVAGALPQIEAKRGGNAALARQAARLAEGLDLLSDAFRLGARSLRLVPPPARTGPRTGRIPAGQRSRLNARIRAAHAQGVGLAYEYHVAALGVREAAGLAQPPLRLSFILPILGEDGCEACGSGDAILQTPLMPARGKRLRQQPGRLDGRQLLLRARRLDEVSLATANHLATLSQLFSVIIVVIAIECSDSCDPVGVVRVSHFWTATSTGPDGRFSPLLGFLWLICCPCSCFYFFTEQRQIDIRVFNQVLVRSPQRTQSRAFAVGRARAAELADDYNGSLSSGTPFVSPPDITPALAPPSCGC
jgi:hypothetical protein